MHDFACHKSPALALFAPVVLALLSACTGVPQPLALDRCVDRYAAFESLAAQRGIFVSEPRGVAQFPSLGTNRSLAGFDPHSLTALQRADWLARLQAAGAERRRLLSAMLSERASFEALPTWWDDLDLQSCDLQTPRFAHDADFDWQALRNAVQVEDDYSSARRALGLYPLSSIFAGFGIQALQERIYDSYAVALSEIPVQGRLHRYSLAASTSDSGQASVQLLGRDSLGLLLEPRSQVYLLRLFQQHAPILEIDEAASYDIPGTPYFDEQDAPRVQLDAPSAYHYASLTPFAGELRLQLNYVFWFDERPRGSAMDSLSGALDGLVWRVTLDSSGEVLLYDSIHPCGCYQQFFLGDHLKARSENALLREPPLIPQRAPSEPGPVLRLSSGSHYLQRVYNNSSRRPEGVPIHRYDLVDYSHLYSLDSANGSRSLFDARGLVSGSERGERFYLWPMGIRSPGAMRERGRQPTAFVGRRHFDDADLLDTLFQPVQP